jgi:hypothetical protein
MCTQNWEKIMQGYKQFFRALMLVVGCFISGCGANQQPAASAPQAVSGVGILVTGAASPEAEKLKTAVEHGLLLAGYRVVSSPEEVHELVAQLDVQLSEKTSIITLYVNGRPKKNYAAHASFGILGGQQLLGSETLEYDVSDGPSTGDVATLVNAVGGSQVTSYLAALKEHRKNAAAAEEKARADAENQKAEAELAQRRDAKQRENAAWNQIVLSDCTNATRLDGCDSVKQFLAQFPIGRHAAEAKTSVEAGAVLIAKLADDRDWMAARADACREPKVSTDCDAVSAYLAAHPAGAHLDDARAALSQSERRRDQLKQEEDKKQQKDAIQAEQEQKREDKKQQDDATQAEHEQKRAAHEQCKKDCLGNTCFNLRPGPFEICMDRCVKAYCD